MKKHGETDAKEVKDFKDYWNTAIHLSDLEDMLKQGKTQKTDKTSSYVITYRNNRGNICTTTFSNCTEQDAYAVFKRRNTECNILDITEKEI